MFTKDNYVESALLDFEADSILQEAQGGSFLVGSFGIGTRYCDALRHVDADVPIDAALRDFEHSMQGRYGRHLH